MNWLKYLNFKFILIQLNYCRLQGGLASPWKLSLQGLANISQSDLTLPI